MSLHEGQLAAAKAPADEASSSRLQRVPTAAATTTAALSPSSTLISLPRSLEALAPPDRTAQPPAAAAAPTQALPPPMATHPVALAQQEQQQQQGCSCVSWRRAEGEQMAVVARPPSPPAQLLLQ